MKVFFPDKPTRGSVFRVVTLFLFCGLVLSVTYLAVTKPTYTTSALIGPSQEQYGSTPSSQLDRASLSILSGGGLLSGPRVITPYDAFLQTIQTREVAERLFNNLEIRAEVFPGVWNSQTKSWNEFFSLRAFILAPLYWITNRTYPTHPTVDTLADILKNRVQLTMIDRGPMYKVTYAARDPRMGAFLLQQVFYVTDEIVKSKERRQVLLRIRALRERMKGVDIVDYRAQFTNLVMDQEKLLILLQGDTDFASKVIATPNTPDSPDSPRLFVTIAIFLALSFILSLSVLAMAYRELITGQLRTSK